MAAQLFSHMSSQLAYVKSFSKFGTNDETIE